MANIKIYIPSFIGSVNYDPVRTLPHVYFYNGQVDCQPWWFSGQYQSGSSGVLSQQQFNFPYFDHYDVVSGSFPTANSHTLLFNNEEPVYGSAPTASLYSEYWSKYVELLYNPYTRLIDASAIIPLADYADLYLNDIVEWRGDYYHLRAINNYSVKTGECNIQLLGPILADALDYINGSCNFKFTSATITTTTTTTAGPTTTTTAGPTTTTTSTTSTTTAGPTTTTTLPPSGSIVTNGLVTWQSCNSITGSNWYDKSGNNNHATISGSFTTGSNGVNFNGINTSVVWTSDPLNATPSSSFTMQIYGKINANTRSELFNKRYYNNGWDTTFVPAGTFTSAYVVFRDEGGYDSGANLTIPADSVKMMTLALSDIGGGQGIVNFWQDTTAMALSRNPVPWNGFNAATGPLSDTRLMFGNQVTVDDAFISGSISNLLIYNRKLSDAEVLQNYNYFLSNACNY